MIKNEYIDLDPRSSSRRRFLDTLGMASAGLLVAPYLRSANVFARGLEDRSSYLAQVAVTQATTYERTLIKQKVQLLFDSIGGIGDVVNAGDKVAIKINLTGGGSGVNAVASNVWTHPEVLRAVGELIIDSGVNANDLYIVESLWSADSYNKNGYLDVQQSLGAQMVDLNGKAPFSDFATRSVGSNSSAYDSFTMNHILDEVNVYVSIPKMKQHYEAGVTASLKNQIGIVPKQLYVTSNTGRRDALHTKDGTVSSTTHLPKSICDLNFARPVHLAIIDGVKNARGGEGTWNPTFRTYEDHVLLAGKDPVAADSIAAHIMGNDPEANTLALPDGGQCDNYLEILHQKGMGTNQINEIEIVGDGASLVSVGRNERLDIPTEYRMYQNYPNPFNPSTTIKFYLPHSEQVTMRMYSLGGKEIETLLEREVSAGHHDIRWIPRNLASGVYICRMRAGRFADSRKLVYQK
jgi:uncharacterized protein (DUF362 family)